MRAILFLMMLGVASAFGADAQSSFAAQAYADAAKQMEQTVATAPPSAGNYYDLGLAYEKAGDTIPAVLNYERALLLDPGLRPARNSLATLAASKSIPLPPHRWVDEVNAVAHPDTLVWSGAVLAWAGVFGLLCSGRWRKNRGLVNALSVISILVGVSLLSAGWLTDARMAVSRPAVVTSKEGVEVLTAPANNSTPVISLPPGTPVGVRSPRGAWTYIDVNGGARGWVQTDRLTPVFPGDTLL